MNNLRTVILIVIIFILGISGIYWYYRTQVVNQNKGKLLPIPTVEPIPAEKLETRASPQPDTASTQSTTTTTPPVQPVSGSDTITIKNSGIQINSPEPESKISSPLKVSGFANILGNIIIHLKDSNGNILGEGKAQACIGYDACPFTTTIYFEVSSTQSGTVEAYNESTLDKSLHHAQSILIRF